MLSITPPSAPKKNTANAIPDTYERLANTLGSTSGVAPARLRRTWDAANSASTGSEPASTSFVQSGQPSSRPCTSG